MCTHQRLTYGRGEQQTIKKSNRILIIGLIRNKKKIKCVKNDEISLFLSLKKKKKKNLIKLNYHHYFNYSRILLYLNN